MDILKMVAELRWELEHLDQAILSLERIQHKAGQPRASTKSQTAELKSARPGGRGNGSEPQFPSGRQGKKKVAEDGER